jgi:hypothetical protein
MVMGSSDPTDCSVSSRGVRFCGHDVVEGNGVFLLVFVIVKWLLLLCCKGVFVLEKVL